MLRKDLYCAYLLNIFYGLSIITIFSWRHHFVTCVKEIPAQVSFSSNDIVAQFNLPSTSAPSTAHNNGNRSKGIYNIETGGDYPSKNYFTHLSFDFMHNVLFAGATNKLLKLNENLRVLSEAVTGPLNDSPQCHAGGCPDDIETTLVNNYNKILVVSYAHDGILISCGSIRQGYSKL
ncbi:plexin-B isoform X2 [Drosophila rhopaloa]|uniref:Sema domain-containing protein n=1 Tax=Drosophila rhopaloa TaxID=1041015 RepID=A0ABM5JCR9_DRORH|nr:plexin-B isoform X2 [Drosophila rhopaloa]